MKQKLETALSEKLLGERYRTSEMNVYIVGPDHKQNVTCAADARAFLG